MVELVTAPGGEIPPEPSSLAGHTAPESHLAATLLPGFTEEKLGHCSSPGNLDKALKKPPPWHLPGMSDLGASWPEMMPKFQKLSLFLFTARLKDYRLRNDLKT